MSARLLAIYLNDHLATARLELELARRARSSNAGDPVFGDPLAELCAEIEADRATLEDVMRGYGVRRDPLKPAAAWAAEKLGRLKLNGQLRGYSPLSRVVELEGLHLALTGKRRLWIALDRIEDGGGGEFGFAGLAERARDQLARIEELHRKATELAFAE